MEGRSLHSRALPAGCLDTGEAQWNADGRLGVEVAPLNTMSTEASGSPVSLTALGGGGGFPLTSMAYSEVGPRDCH